MFSKLRFNELGTEITRQDCKSHKKKKVKDLFKTGKGVQFWSTTEKMDYAQYSEK